MVKIIYKDISYKVVGILFDIAKELGSSFHEKYYQRALEVHLRKESIPFKKESKVDIKVIGNKIGHHYIDFVIDDKLVLEVKKGNIFRMADIKQVLMYLRSANYKLGLLVYFGSGGVRVKRVINSSYRI